MCIAHSVTKNEPYKLADFSDVVFQDDTESSSVPKLNQAEDSLLLPEVVELSLDTNEFDLLSLDPFVLPPPNQLVENSNAQKTLPMAGSPVVADVNLPSLGPLVLDDFSDWDGFEKPVFDDNIFSSGSLPSCLGDSPNNYDDDFFLNSSDLDMPLSPPQDIILPRALSLDDTEDATHWEQQQPGGGKRCRKTKRRKGEEEKPRRRRKLARDMAPDELTKLREMNRAAAKRHRDLVRKRAEENERKIAEFDKTNAELRASLEGLQQEKYHLLSRLRTTQSISQ
eukprot:m.98716 g.98716  ORF g.98716 m.98716 type:complete len:282 (+) comp22122_c0_seq2:102-947(+)